MTFGRSFLASLLAVLLAWQTVLAASFSDIAPTDQNRGAVEWLQTLGVAKNAPRFYPARPVTLAEFLTFGLLAAGVDPATLTAKNSRFADVPADSWFAPYVVAAERLGVLDSYTGTLKPNRSVSRGEAAQLGLKLFGMGPAATVLGEKFGFTDVDPKTPQAAYIFQAAKLGVLTPVSDKTFDVRGRLTRADAAVFFFALHENTGTTIINLGGGLNVPGGDFLAAIWEEVDANFLYADKLDQQKMLHGALEGLLNSLDDPYSVFLAPEQSSSLNSNLSGEVEGIGAYLEMNEKTNLPTIVAPLKGSPAEAAGLLPGDVITAVDGQTTAGESLSDVTARIKGPAGSSVKLGIERSGQKLEITVTRQKITIHSVDLKWQGDVAVLSISQFDSTTTDEFAAAAKEIAAKHARGLVLDLRNNPGGLLDTAVDVLGHFVPTGSVALKTQYRAENSAKNTVYKTAGTPELQGLRTAVLINKGSASAAEILAGALQDYGVAKLVGETSFGKGVMQELSFFADGTALKLTTAFWLTPKDRSVNKVGLVPDLAATDDPATANVDETLEAALRTL